MDPPEKMDAVKVAVRIRPILQKESQNGRISMWETKDKSINQKDESQPIYTFDCVYDENCTTYELHDEVSSPIVKSAMTGIHGTVFAYGQSGSGKTFTMSGDSMVPGLIRQAATEIFDYVEDCPNREFLLRMCYMEIYQEKISDLLSTEKDKPIKIQEDTDHQINVIGLEEVHVTCLAKVYEVIKQGDLRRKTAATKQNDRSSRSHSILRMIIESRETGEDDAVMLSHLNFVDLAGSEKAGENSGDRLKEGCAINKSLLSLSQVISKLSEGDGEGYIGYRDSKLTRILQNALGGNSKTAIICTIAPTSIEESHSTLKFASRAKKIKNKPHVNEVLNGDALLKKYRMEIQKLQKSASEMGVIDMQMEKNALETKLKEKEDIECEQKRLIESLQRMICTSNSNPEEKKVEVQKKKMRRETWAAPKSRRISHFPGAHVGGISFAPNIDGNSFLSPYEMDFSAMDIPESRSRVQFREENSIAEISIFSTFSDTSMASSARNTLGVTGNDIDTDKEKEAMKIKLSELERMLDELNQQYYNKVDELEELRQFTSLEKNITESDIVEKIQTATEKMKNDLDQQSQYITQIEAELYKVVDDKTELSQQLSTKKEDLVRLQVKIEKSNQESDKQHKTNQDYITMLERQVEQSESKLQNVDKLRHSTGQILTTDKKLADEKEKKSLKDEIDKLTSQLEEKNYEMDTLKMENIELSKHQEKAREYRMKLQELQDSKESIGLDNFESSEVIVGLKTKIEDLEAELELKNEALNNVDLAADTFQSGNTELETRVTSLESELSQQKDLFVEKVKEFEALKSEFDENNYLLTQKDEAFNLLQAELDESKEVLTQTNKSCIELEDGIEKFKIEINSLQKELAEKNQALEAIDLDNMANAESQISQFGAEIENLEKKLDEKTVENEKLQLEFTTNKQEMSSQIKRLAEELEAKDIELKIIYGNSNEVEILQSTVQELQQKLREAQNSLNIKSQHIETLESMSNVSFTEELGVPQSAWTQPSSTGISLQDELKQKTTGFGMSLEDELRQSSSGSGINLEDELRQAPTGSGMSLEDELRQIPTGSGMSLEDELRQSSSGSGINLEDKLRQAPTGSGMSLEDELRQTPTGSGMSLPGAPSTCSQQEEVHQSCILELEKQLKEALDKLSELNSTLGLKKEEESCLKEQVCDLQVKLNQCSIDIDAMNTNTEQQISMKNAEIEHLNSELTLLKSEHSVEEINEKLAEKESEVSKFKQQLKDLENKQQNLVEEETAKIYNLEKQVEELQSLLESKEIEITDLMDKIEDSNKCEDGETDRRLSFESGNVSGQVQELKKFFEMECTPSKKIRKDSNQILDEVVAQKAGLEAKLEEANDQVQELKGLLEGKEDKVNEVTNLLENLSSVNDKVTEYEKQLQDKEQTIFSLQQAKKNALQLEVDHCALQEKMTLLEEELQMKSEALTDTLSQVTELEQQIETLQNEVGDLETIVDKETNENTENKDRITGLQEEVSSYRTEVEKLNDHIKELTSNFQKSSHDYQKLQEDHTELQTWYQKQQDTEALRAEGKDAESLLKDQLTELREEFNSKRDEMDTLKLNLKEQLNDKNLELATLQNEMETIAANYEKEKETKSTIEKEIIVLKEELANKNEEMGKIESDHNETISNKDEELIHLQTELESLKKEIESELSLLLDEKSNLENKVQTLEEENASLKDDLEEKILCITCVEKNKLELEEDFKEFSSKHEEILAAKKTETTSLQEELTHAKSSVSEKEISIKTLEVEVLENKELLMEEISKLQISLEEKDTLLSELKLEHADKIRELETQLPGVDDYQEQMKRLCSEHEEKEDLLKLQIKSLQEQLSKSKSTQEHMKIQAEEHSAKEVALKKLIESLHEQLSSKSDLHEQILKIREEYSRTENHLHEQITELKSLLLQKDTEILSLDEESKRLKTKIDEFQTEMSEMESTSKKERSKLDEELAELRSQLSEKEAQVETLKNDLNQIGEDLNKQILTLQSDLEESDSTIQQLQEELSRSCTKVTKLKQENLNCSLIESPETNAEERINKLVHEKADFENRLEELRKENTLKLEEIEQGNKAFQLEMKKQRLLLRTQVKELTTEKERLQRGFNLYRGRCNDMVTDYRLLKEEKATWDEQLAEKQAKWSGLDKKAINLNLENHQLKTTMEKESAEYEKRFAALNDTIEYKENVITRLKDQLRRQTTDLDNTTCEAVPTVKKANDHQIIEVSSKDKIVDIYTLRLIEAENEKLKSDLESMNVKLKDLTNEKEKLHARVQNYKEKIKEFSTGKAAPQAQCDKENVQSLKRQKFSAEELEETVCSPEESFNFEFGTPPKPMIPVIKKEEKVKLHTLKGLSPSKDPSKNCKQQ